MIKKRFEIVKSKLIKDGWVINDKLKQFTFPTLKGDKRALISYCKALNELHEENQQYQEWLDALNEELSLANRDNTTLEKENKELNSIKCFADNNGINIFNIDEAFRKCWNDNEKLVIENKELQERNNRQAKQLDNIYQLIEQKDYRALNDILDDFQLNGRGF